MDRIHQLASTQQANEFLSNFTLIATNSPSRERTELLVANDEEAGRLGAFLYRHSFLFLQEMTLMLLAVTDPGKGTASLIDFVRRHRPLTTLSLVTAHLYNRDGSSTLENRELVVDAFLKAAIDNPSVTSVSLNCCTFRSGRMSELLSKPGLKGIDLANCRSLDDLSQPGKKEELLVAVRGSVGLETFHVRRTFEDSSLEGLVLLQLATHARLREIGVSIRNVATAAIFRRLIDRYQRPMKFALLGCELCAESADLLIEGFQTRRLDFRVDLKGCTWDSDITRELFLQRLVLCPRLMSLSIDEYCGLSVLRVQYLAETVALRNRLALLRSGSYAKVATWESIG